MNVRMDKCRTYTIDPDTFLCQFPGQANCQRIQSPLSYSVVDILKWCTGLGCNRRNVDNSTSLAPISDGHPFDRFPTTQHRPDDIGLQDTMQSVGRNIYKPAMDFQYPGIVHQTVQPSKMRTHLLKQPKNFLLL